MYDKYWLFGKQVSSTNFTYTRTPGWSDNNHLARTSYYKDLIMKECKDGGFMEGQLYWNIKDEASHEVYGTYLFGGLDEAPYTGHSDGRHTILDKEILIFSKNEETSVYKIIEKNFSSEFKCIWIDPASFNKEYFLKKVKSASVCFADIYYHYDICGLIPYEYYSKFGLLCCQLSHVHTYGSNHVHDQFTCSATTDTIYSEMTKYMVRTFAHKSPRGDLPAWTSFLQTILDKNRTIRIYTKGLFDPYTIDHVNKFEQIKRTYPKSILTVGILEGEDYDTRVKMIQSCKYVDEICHRAPSVETESFLKKYNIDLIL